MLKCILVSATDRLEEIDLEGVFVQAVTGELGVLRNHLPLVAKLKNNSVLRLKTARDQKFYTLGNNSFLHFSNNEAVVLTQSFSAVKILNCV